MLVLLILLGISSTPSAPDSYFFLRDPADCPCDLKQIFLIQFLVFQTRQLFFCDDLCHQLHGIVELLYFSYNKGRMVQALKLETSIYLVEPSLSMKSFNDHSNCLALIGSNSCVGHLCSCPIVQLLRSHWSTTVLTLAIIGCVKSRSLAGFTVR